MVYLYGYFFQKKDLALRVMYHNIMVVQQRCERRDIVQGTVNPERLGGRRAHDPALVLQRFAQNLARFIARVEQV